MDNLPSGFDPDYYEAMQREARAEFPAFFAIASPHEAQLMDAAYVGSQVHRMASQTPRPRADDPVREPLELVTFNAEQLLLHVRGTINGALRAAGDDEIEDTGWAGNPELCMRTV